MKFRNESAFLNISLQFLAGAYSFWLCFYFSSEYNYLVCSHIYRMYSYSYDVCCVRFNAEEPQLVGSIYNYFVHHRV